MYEINIKEEVYKCSKCGLCQSVCPMFTALKNEMYLPRGRFNILNNYFNNGKQISENFIKEIDICLNCNACKKFCPSSIDSVKIFTILKNQYNKNLLPFLLKYKLILLNHSLKKHFAKNKLYKITAKRNSYYASSKKADIVYFQGCFNRYINPSDKNAALNLLKQNGYNVIKIMDNCCGLPYLSDGNLKNFDKNAKKIIKSIPIEAKYIVTSCDSCYNTLDNIFGQLCGSDDAVIGCETGLDKNKNPQLIRIDDLITSLKATKNAVFHKPFSLEKYSGLLPVINKKFSCSLMENYFLLKHPEIIPKIIDALFYKKEDIENKIIVTSCNLTKWGIYECCKLKCINTDVVSLCEYSSEI